MGLDIRWPIGLMFTLIGLLLAIYGGVQGGAAAVQVSGSSVNIDLVWGVVLLVFGGAMLLGAASGGKPTPKDPSGK